MQVNVIYMYACMLTKVSQLVEVYVLSLVADLLEVT